MIRPSRPDESRSEGIALRQAERRVPSLLERLQHYAEEQPISAALWCFAIGLVVGWRLKS
jgi:uncharacterized protein YijF (DUF1287 family)